MTRPHLSVILPLTLAVMILAVDSRATPEVIQQPPTPQKWTRGPGALPNTWIITVEENPTPLPGGAGLNARTIFTILRDPLNPTEPVIIEKLTIKRPGSESREIEVNLGVDSPDGRLASVQEIVVQEGFY